MKQTSFFLLLCIVLGSCFAPKQASQTKQTFTFDYTPKENSKAGSAGMVVAFVRPYYAEEFASTGSGELFKSFQDAIGNDVEELIIAKGFTMKGPYHSFDEMVFEDKKTTEMLIQIEIAPRFTAQEGSWKTHISLLGPAYYTYSYSGKASLVGKINISGVEPLTNQKIWSKSVLIPNVENISIETSNKYKRPLDGFELVSDPGVYNVLGKALMQQYSGIMDKIVAHFNVDEFKTLKGQIKELKAMKGY
ncbi:MAG: hypothetical protein JNK14_06825 [Chitinophagaceae bacterium]|nr:hypothetical protein [Chitinophagaceae bacterium]